MAQVKKVTIFLLTIVALCLFIALPINAVAAGPNTGPQTWSLDSKNDKDSKKLPVSVCQMEKNFGPGDDGQAGNISISGGESFIWVSDQVVENDITIPSGAWIFQFVTDSDWGTQGSKCQIEIGEWDGSFKSLTPPPLALSSRKISTAIYSTLFQSKTITIGKGKLLALRVISLEKAGKKHIIYTGEGNLCSYLRSTQTFSVAPPVPELPAGMLLALGLAGLGIFIFVKRLSPSASCK
jgi:hypothetical protein